MLEFEETEDCYVIVERIHSFTSTRIMVVSYTKDLKMKQINSEPWSETDQPTIDWFNKHYRKHFKGGDFDAK